MTTDNDLIKGVEAGDIGLVQSLLQQDGSLAAARNSDGVSALMLAAYRRNDAMIALLRTHLTWLDLFEAASLGDLNEVRHRVADAASIRSFSADGFTA